MAQEEEHGPSFQCVLALLSPLAHFCVRHEIRLQQLVEAVKIAFIEAGAADLQSRGEVVSASRLCIMTGVHRQDIARLEKSAGAAKIAPNQVTRVIGHWIHDRRYLTKQGTPRVLSVEGRESEFFKLVSDITGDLDPYTILFELERRKLVERTPRGIRLVERAHILRDDMVDLFQMVSRDVNDLVVSVEENMTAPALIPNLHLTTYYDKVPERYQEKIRAWFIKEGSTLHRKARAFLSKFDRDLNPDLAPDSSYVRVALCSYSRVEEEMNSAMQIEEEAL